MLENAALLERNLAYLVEILTFFFLAMPAGVMFSLWNVHSTDTGTFSLFFTNCDT